jgi:hypothetical protein
MTSCPNLRLLTIALQECTPALELATFAALPGFDWIGDAADCNEGLRQDIDDQSGRDRDAVERGGAEAAPRARSSAETGYFAIGGGGDARVVTVRSSRRATA